MIQDTSSREAIRKLVDSSFNDMVKKSVDPYYYQKEFAYNPAKYNPNPKVESGNSWIIVSSIAGFVIVLALILFRKKFKL